MDIIRSLALAKSREAPELRLSVRTAWQNRWLNILSVAAQTAVSETLLAPGSPHLTEIDGDEPPVGELLALDVEAPVFSRMPMRW